MDPLVGPVGCQRFAYDDDGDPPTSSACPTLPLVFRLPYQGRFIVYPRRSQILILSGSSQVLRFTNLSTALSRLRNRYSKALIHLLRNTGRQLRLHCRWRSSMLSLIFCMKTSHLSRLAPSPTPHGIPAAALTSYPTSTSTIAAHLTPSSPSYESSRACDRSSSLSPFA